MSDGGGSGPARRRRRKEENSWVDKSTIKFEILRESPAFVILELHGNGFSPHACPPLVVGRFRLVFRCCIPPGEGKAAG